MIKILINGERIDAQRFTLKLAPVLPINVYSSLLSVTTKDGALGDNIEIFSNDISVFVGIITTTTTNNLTAESNLINYNRQVIETKQVINYSPTYVRVPINFTIKPDDNVITPVHDLIVANVTHYNLYSDVFF